LVARPNRIESDGRAAELALNSRLTWRCSGADRRDGFRDIIASLGGRSAELGRSAARFGLIDRRAQSRARCFGVSDRSTQDAPNQRTKSEFNARGDQSRRVSRLSNKIVMTIGAVILIGFRGNNLQGPTGPAKNDHLLEWAFCPR